MSRSHEFFDLPSKDRFVVVDNTPEWNDSCCANPTRIKVDIPITILEVASMMRRGFVQYEYLPSDDDMCLLKIPSPSSADASIPW